MPHVTPTPVVQSVPPVHSGEPIHYTSGDALPASIDDDARGRPLDAHSVATHALDESESRHQASHQSPSGPNSRDGSRSRSRVREFVKSVSRSVSRDPFFQPGQGQESEEKANIARQVNAALASTEAGDMDRVSREHSRTREFIKSVSRSVSRDPFFRRGTGTPEEQREEQRRINLAQVQHALDSTAAGNEDRDRRHAHEGEGSKSRSQSRSRADVGAALGF